MKKLMLVSMISIFSLSVKAQETIKIVAGEAFAPLMWNDNGKAAGIAIEVAKAVFEKAGYKVVAETCPWNRCQMIAENDGAFIIGFSKNEERIKKYMYSDAYMYDEVVLVVKKGKEFPFAKNEDVKGKTVGFQLGSSFGQDFEEMKKHFKSDNDNADPARIKKLVAGQIDAGIFSLGIAGMNYSAKLAGVDAGELVVLPRPVAKDPNFIATGNKTKNGKEILDKVNAAIKALTADGTIDKLTKKTY